jgi:hypothetical protein
MQYFSTLTDGLNSIVFIFMFFLCTLVSFDHQSLHSSTPSLRGGCTDFNSFYGHRFCKHYAAVWCASILSYIFLVPVSVLEVV